MKTLGTNDLRDLVGIVVGTRPGIIKQSPTIRAIRELGIPYFVFHSGQHYSPDMDAQFFQDLGLEAPRHRVEGVEQRRLHGGQTARMLEGVEQILVEERPRIVLVLGDANTNLAAALAARKLQIRVGHIEAGLRSRDWRMPEEHNRVIMDHICEYLFAPTETARQNLERENVLGQILVTGNPVVDAVKQNLEMARARSDVLARVGVRHGEFVLLTTHREENVDDEDRLRMVLDAVRAVSDQVGLPVLFPAHPRTRDRLERFDLIADIEEDQRVLLARPAGYLDFLVLMEAARLILTDSGGIQEEACTIGTPCVTLRETTERPETVDVGANIVAGLNREAVLMAAAAMVDAPGDWRNPYGDGRASERIAQFVGSELQSPSPLPV